MILNYIFNKTPLIWFIESFWRDEAFSVILAGKNVFEILLLTAKDFSPPLYYLILKCWMIIFGSSEIAVRSLSLIFYTLTLYVFCEFIINIFNIKSKPFIFLCSILFCFNPLLSYYAFEGRGYTMFAFFSLAAIYYLERKRLNLSLAFFVLSFFTHYFAALLVFYYVAYYFNNICKLKLNKHGLSIVIYAIKQVYVYFLPIIVWVFFVIANIKNGDTNVSQFWIPRPDIYDLVNFFAILVTGFEKTFWFKFDLKIINIVIIALITGAFAYTKCKIFKRLAFTVLSSAVIVFVVSCIFNSLFLPRYFIALNPMLYLCIVYAIYEISSKVQKFFTPKLDIIKYTFIICLFAALIYELRIYGEIQIKNRTRADLKQIITNLKNRAHTNDLLFVKSELDFHVAQVYWFNKNNVKIWNKPYIEIPQYVGKVLIKPDDCTKDLSLYNANIYLLEDEKTIANLTPNIK